ncbi:hypothetical protein Tco_0362848 [Tanacetum coccineum]
MTFSNPFSDSNDFTSSDNESHPDERNEDECFDPEGDNDEIDAFLAIEVPTYIEEGYYDSDGDVYIS